MNPLAVLTRRKPERANSRSPSMTAPSPTTSKSWAADGVWSTSRRSIRRATRSTSSSTASRFQDARLSVKLPIRVSLIAGLGSRKMLKIQDISYLYHRKVIFGQFSAIFLQYMYLKSLKIQKVQPFCIMDTFSKYLPQPCPIDTAFSTLKLTLFICRQSFGGVAPFGTDGSQQEGQLPDPRRNLGQRRAGRFRNWPTVSGWTCK